MKSCFLVLAIVIGFLNQSLYASECRVIVHSGEFANVFGADGYVAATKILNKKGYIVSSDEDAEYRLSSRKPYSSSLWDMWSPISKSWSFSILSNGTYTVIESGTITGKTFHNSDRSMVRKLKKALKKQLPDCIDSLN